jgi:hypothetical protein
MRIFFILISITLLSTGCLVKNDFLHKYVSSEINSRFKKLQEFTMEYELENGGPVFDSDVSIYKINKKQCVLVSKIDGDSGVYGTETILYFYNSKVLYGYYVNYNYRFLNGEGSIKLNEVNYENPEIENSLIELEKEFSKYINDIAKNTLSECSN